MKKEQVISEVTAPLAANEADEPKEETEEEPQQLLETAPMNTKMPVMC